MKNACDQYGLQELTFKEYGDGIKVTVYRTQTDKQKTSEQTNKRTNEQTNKQIIEREIKKKRSDAMRYSFVQRISDKDILYLELGTRWLVPFFFGVFKVEVLKFLIIFGAPCNSLLGKVEIPFSYVWTEGWRTVLGHMLPDFGMMLAIVIVICLAPIFSGEWHNRTGAMILTMKQGWKKDARAKVAGGFCFAVELFLLISIPSIIVQMVYLGTQG